MVLRRVQAESTTSQAQFMEKVHTPSQEKSKFESEVDELAIGLSVGLNYSRERQGLMFKFSPYHLRALKRKRLQRSLLVLNMKWSYNNLQWRRE